MKGLWETIKFLTGCLAILTVCVAELLIVFKLLSEFAKWMNTI